MEHCKHMEEHDIHVIDYSGTLGMMEGLARIENLERYLTEHVKDKNIIKVLLEAKGHKKDRPEIHDAIAKIARAKIDSEFKSVNMFLAVLNDHYSCAISEKERWFITKEDAVKWLTERTQ